MKHPWRLSNIVGVPDPPPTPSAEQSATDYLKQLFGMTNRPQGDVQEALRRFKEAEQHARQSHERMESQWQQWEYNDALQKRMEYEKLLAHQAEQLQRYAGIQQQQAPHFPDFFGQPDLVAVPEPTVVWNHTPDSSIPGADKDYALVVGSEIAVENKGPFRGLRPYKAKDDAPATLIGTRRIRISIAAVPETNYATGTVRWPEGGKGHLSISPAQAVELAQILLRVAYDIPKPPAEPSQPQDESTQKAR